MSASGADLTIDAAGDLDFGDTYAVLIDSNAVEDLYSNAFGGITNTTTWRLTTDAPPVLSALSPTNNATDVKKTVNLVASFDDAITLIDGGVITITNLTAGTATNLTLPDVQVSVSGMDLTINPDAYLNVGAVYAVLVDGDSVEDENGYNFAGISSDTTWRFRVSKDPSATLVAYWPLNDGANGEDVTTADDVIDDPSHPATDATSSGDGDTWVKDPQRGIVYSTTAAQHLDAGGQGITGDVTWSLWVKTTNADGDILMGNRHGSSPFNKLMTTGLHNWAPISPAEPDYWGISDGAWHHMVMRRENTTVSVWVDGVQFPTTATQAADQLGTLRIGGDAEGWGESLTGLLSDVAIWDEALTESRIQGLANGVPVTGREAPRGTTLIVR